MAVLRLSYYRRMVRPRHYLLIAPKITSKAYGSIHVDFPRYGAELSNVLYW